MQPEEVAHSQTRLSIPHSVRGSSVQVVKHVVKEGDPKVAVDIINAGIRPMFGLVDMIGVDTEERIR